MWTVSVQDYRTREAKEGHKSNQKGRASMTEYEIVEKLQKHLKATEVYHVTTYNCDRTRPDGPHQEVEITILDRGPSNPETRYHVTAKASDGKSASGNSGPDLETVLALVHWYELDK